MLLSLRKLPALFEPLQRRVLSLRTPTPLIVATVLTLFIGGLLAIVLLSPTDQTKRPTPAAQVTSRFFNPAWTRQPAGVQPDTPTVTPTSEPTSQPTPTAEPGATITASPTMAPPQPTGSDTSPDKRGSKSGTGKPQKQRPKWF
jgi:cytoskeletal protein RodZ